MVKMTKVGDAVYGMLDGWQGGTFAEYVAVKANQLSQKPDIFFDVFGNQRFKAIKPILKHKGVWVSTVVQPHVFFSVAKTMFFSRKKAKLVVVKSSREDLTKVQEWVQTGELKPIVHEIYPLEKIREAYAQQETKHTRGKVVIRI